MVVAVAEPLIGPELPVDCGISEQTGTQNGRFRCPLGGMASDVRLVSGFCNSHGGLQDVEVGVAFYIGGSGRSVASQ